MHVHLSATPTETRKIFFDRNKRLDSKMYYQSLVERIAQKEVIKDADQIAKDIMRSGLKVFDIQS